MYAFWYKTDGSIASVYAGLATVFNNIPSDCAGVVSFDNSDTTAQDAYTSKDKYIVQNDKLVVQPYFTLTFASGTVTATLNNPPATLPIQVTFSVLGQAYTVDLVNGQATLSLNLHPAVASQQINVTASATGCVNGSLNIGGSGTSIPMKMVTTTTPNTISPVYRKDGEAHYANLISTETLLADIGTANSLVTHFTFDKVPAALRLLNSLLTWAQQATYAPFKPSTQDTADITAITLTTDEQNALTDVNANLMTSLYTTLANAYPSGGTKQLQYARYVADSQTSYTSFSDYVRDIQTLGWQ